MLQVADARLLNLDKKIAHYVSAVYMAYELCP